MRKHLWLGQSEPKGDREEMRREAMGADDGEVHGPPGGPPLFPEMAPHEGSEQERDIPGVHKAPLAACEEQPVRAEWGYGEDQAGGCLGVTGPGWGRWREKGTDSG